MVNGGKCLVNDVPSRLHLNEGSPFTIVRNRAILNYSGQYIWFHDEYGDKIRLKTAYIILRYPLITKPIKVLVVSGHMSTDVILAEYNIKYCSKLEIQIWEEFYWRVLLDQPAISEEFPLLDRGKEIEYEQIKIALCEENWQKPNKCLVNNQERRMCLNRKSYFTIVRAEMINVETYMTSDVFYKDEHLEECELKTTYIKLQSPFVSRIMKVVKVPNISTDVILGHKDITVCSEQEIREWEQKYL